MWRVWRQNLLRYRGCQGASDCALAVQRGLAVVGYAALEDYSGNEQTHYSTPVYPVKQAIKGSNSTKFPYRERHALIAKGTC